MVVTLYITNKENLVFTAVVYHITVHYKLHIGHVYILSVLHSFP